MQITSMFEKIIFLLRDNKEDDWAVVFEKLLQKFTSSNNKKEVAREILCVFQGGMGSFNDLVLQKDDKMLIEENNQLDKLKHDLYNSCCELIVLNCPSSDFMPI